MKRVLVVNHAHSEVCGIHDLGMRIYGCLMRSSDLAVSYISAPDENLCRGAIALWEPDAVIFNYRADLMPWVPSVLRTNRATFAVLHQYEEATADARAAELLAAGFDHVLALDPGLSPSDPRVHAVGRPIPECAERDPLYVRCPGRPNIGSFGFAFPHKGFADVAAEIRALNTEAEYRLHMPEAYFNGVGGASLYAGGILADIGARVAGPRVKVIWTFEHLPERELVARLAANDVNCLFYAPGQPDAGLSSAIDYLIAASRPMLVSGCAMFRVAWNAPTWPDTRLGDILANYDHYQAEADVLYESMAGRFVRDIEKIVGEL